MYSINVTVFNKGFLIYDVLTRIKKFTTGKYELIVVIDGCIDDSESEIKRFIADNQDVNITVLYAPNIFETRANNIAAKKSIGDYIIISQDDMLINEVGWNERMIKPIMKFSNIFAVTSCTAHNWILNPNSLDIHKNHFNGDVAPDILIHTEHANRKNIDRNTFAMRDSVNRGPLALKHDILEQLGYFDELFSPQDMDDHDLCYRASKLGYRCGCYWIDYISDPSWGATRRHGHQGGWLNKATFKNSKILLERHRDLICGEKHNENRTLI
jgi:glycosyltransferase involved in cell wall biosynthesis